MDVQKCGDVIDRFPCRQCGSKCGKECPVPFERRKAASDAINSRRGLASDSKTEVPK